MLSQVFKRVLIKRKEKKKDKKPICYQKKEQCILQLTQKLHVTVFQHHGKRPVAHCPLFYKSYV